MDSDLIDKVRIALGAIKDLIAEFFKGLRRIFDSIRKTPAFEKLLKRYRRLQSRRKQMWASAKPMQEVKVLRSQIIARPVRAVARSRC